jgi:hypothetical protein
MAPSITSWWRLEARARDPVFADALEARIADPLWLLGRQWQTGEFQGVDGGTPVNARARLGVRTLGWYRPGAPSAPGAPQPLDMGVAPLDELVEAEALGADLRLSLAGGRRWMRLLAADAGVVKSWLDAGFGIAPTGGGSTPDPDAERAATATAGRAIDGAAVYAALVEATKASDFGSLPGSTSDVEKAAPAYIEWWEARAGRATGTAPAWQDPRMEYEFAVATSTGDETVLAARGYRGGGLDWPAFDNAEGRAMRPAGGAGADEVVAVALPSPVTFKGMPAPRWWQFEDSAVSFPAIDAAPDDLARLFALEFALIYGNDFFVIPVRLPVGTLSEVDSLVVEDSFGWSLLIDSSEVVDGAGSPWHMFKLAADARGKPAEPLAGLLLTAPTIGELEGVPVEDVLLARDDVAAMAWAIEKTVLGEAGRPLDRALAAAERARRAELEADPEPAPTGALRYRLATEVPENWYPLLPQQTGLRAINFELGEVKLGPNPTPAPLGAVLGSSSPLRIDEEELSRAGLRVRRMARRVRWSDGTVHLWFGRRAGPGRGESGSGLRFDSAETE